jgi:hypothetical protein
VILRNGVVVEGIHRKRRATRPTCRTRRPECAVVAPATGERSFRAFIDRALYLPKTWTDDAARLRAAHVPEETGFATKPTLALGMIARAGAAKVPFRWVAADSAAAAARYIHPRLIRSLPVRSTSCRGKEPDPAAMPYK